MAIKVGGFNLRPKQCCDSSTPPLNIILSKPKSLATNGKLFLFVRCFGVRHGCCGRQLLLLEHPLASHTMFPGPGLWPRSQWECLGCMVSPRCASSWGETAAFLVIRCGGEHSVKLDVKIRIVPKGLCQYCCPLNLPAFNFGSVSALLL